MFLTTILNAKLNTAQQTCFLLDHLNLFSGEIGDSTLKYGKWFMKNSNNRFESQMSILGKTRQLSPANSWNSLFFPNTSKAIAASLAVLDQSLSKGLFYEKWWWRFGDVYQKSNCSSAVSNGRHFLYWYRSTRWIVRRLFGNSHQNSVFLEIEVSIFKL